jgi:AmmeMemoRadiSam system protein B
MKKIIFWVFIVGLAFGLTGQDLRPVRDDVGFCWDKHQMGRLLDYLKSVDKDTMELPMLVAGISPHDDYLYAGALYYPLFKRISRTVKEVVIFGVTHGTVRKKIGDHRDILIFDSYPLWKGPYKDVKISKLRGYLKQKLDSKLYITNNEAHDLEHSIEAMIPFLQYVNPDIQITPIMVTGMDFETMDRISALLATVIESYIKENNLEIGKDIFFLISADANHYGRDFDNAPYGEDERAHQLGTERDKKIAEAFLAGKIDREKIDGLTGELWGKTFRDYKDTYWCGKYSIPFGMSTVLHLVKQLHGDKELMGKILKYSDTYTEGVIPLKKAGLGITAPFSLKHWVGFFSAGYYLQ